MYPHVHLNVCILCVCQTPTHVHIHCTCVYAAQKQQSADVYFSVKIACMSCVTIIIMQEMNVLVRGNVGMMRDLIVKLSYLCLEHSARR